MEKMLGLNGGNVNAEGSMNGGEANLNGGDEGFNGVMNGGENMNMNMNLNNMEGGRRRRSRKSARKSVRKVRKSRRSSSKSRRSRKTRKSHGGQKKNMTGLATVGALIAAQQIYGRRNKRAVSAVNKRRSRRGKK